MSNNTADSNLRDRAWQHWLWCLLVGLVLVWAAVADRWIFAALVHWTALQIDPQIYYCSALAHAQGMDPYQAVYPPDCFARRFRFVYPPAVLELFTWLRPPSLAWARGILVTLYALAFVGLTLGLRRLLWPRLGWPLALLVAVLANPATLGQWSYFGNIAILLYLIILLAALLLWRRPAIGRPALLAAIVVAACFKWILAVYLLVFWLVEGRAGWRWVGAAAVLLALLYGIDFWRAPLAFRAYVANFDIHRTLLDLGMGIPTFGYDLVEGVTGRPSSSPRAEWLGRGIWLLFVVIYLLLAWRVAWRPRPGATALDRRHRVLLGLLLAALLLPRVKDYDWYLLLPVLVYFLTATAPGQGARLPSTLLLVGKIAMVALLLLMPFHTAFYVMAFGTAAWLAGLERGWLVLRVPDPAVLLPPPLARRLLRPVAD